MPPESPPKFLTKFSFRIRTRSGTPVENLLIQAADQAQAEHRLQQMYPYCEILECRELTAHTCASHLVGLCEVHQH